MGKLSILNIIQDTTVDGPGFRTSIYAAGCIHKCEACHNPQSWDKHNGKLYHINDLLEVIKEADFANVTFTGGDPLIQVEGFTELATLIKKETRKNIWCYTGFTYEQISKSKKLSLILPYIDVIIDGKFISSLHKESLLFRGSSNQRIVDVQQSILNKKLTLWREETIEYK